MAEVTCVRVHQGAVAFARGPQLCVWQSASDLWLSSHHSAVIRAIAYTGQHWVTAGDDKRILFHDLGKDLAVQQEIVHHKKVTAMDYLAGKVVYADKFGEVWSIDTDRLTSGPAAEQPCVAFAMGHQSSILSLSLERDKLLTVDIEQKLKVSSFPNMFELQAILMGHTAPICSGVLDAGQVFSLDVEGRVIRWEDLEIAAEGKVNGGERLIVTNDSLICASKTSLSLLDKDTLHVKQVLGLPGQFTWTTVLGDTLVALSSEGEVTQQSLSALAAD